MFHQRRGAKEAEHGESWFLPAVEDEIARLNRDGRVDIDKCLDVDIFFAKCMNLFQSGFVLWSD